MTVSFIIPARNAGATLGGTLSSIKSLSSADHTEVLVVDSASTDETASVAAASGVTVLRAEAPGASRARNLGIRNTSGDLLAFIDADVELPPDWLERMARAFDDPWVDIVQSAVIPATALEQSSARWKTRGTFNTLSAPGALPSLDSAALMVRRQFLEARNVRFDERFDRLEDTQFALESFFAGAHFAEARTIARKTERKNFLQLCRRSFDLGVSLSKLRRFWKRSFQTEMFPGITSMSLSHRFGIAILSLFQKAGELAGTVSDGAPETPIPEARPDHRYPLVSQSTGKKLTAYTRIIVRGGKLETIDAREC